MMFIKTLLFDHLVSDQPSLEQHGFSIYNDAGTRISKQGIDKRFNQHAVTLIQSVFQKYLMNQLKTEQLPSSLRERYTSIRVMDSTEFKLPPSSSESFPGFAGDGTKACAQIQFEFDVLSGKINHLSIENALVADSTYASNRLSTLNEGDLVLRDLGYYTLKSYQEIESRKAYYISRLKPQFNIYEKKGNILKQLKHKSIIKRLKGANKQYLDLQVYIGEGGKHPVRLIANLVNNKSIAHRLKNKKRRKRKLNQADRLYSQLNLFVTNIPHNHCAANDIYQLYKIRWQIELIFKTWKSVLKIDRIRRMKPDRIKCYLFSKLLWITLSWEICILHRLTIWKASSSFISLYKCFSLLKLQAIRIKSILFSSMSVVQVWVQNLYKTFTDYGLKDERHKRINSADLFKMDDIFAITNESHG